MLSKLNSRVVRCLLSFCFGSSPPKTQLLFGVRHVQMVLLFFGLILAYAMRVNMSIALVAMTSQRNDTSLFWTMQTQSIILSSFFWGYIILQVPGGELANRFGGKVLLTIAIGANSVIVLLIPSCAKYGNWKLICACRAIQGLTQGVIFPSVHNLIGKWAPVEEKSRLGAFTYAGTHLGTALQLTSAGYIADRWGWSMIFHSVGVLGVIWTIVYFYLGSSSPETSRTISGEERDYIQESLGVAKGYENLQTPWKAILTSKPFLALALVHCGHNWGFWTLLAEIPSYMKLILGVDIKANGVLSALPYLAMYLLSFPLGIIFDYCLKKQWLSLSATRKLSNSIGLYGAAAALIALCYVPPTNVGMIVKILILAIAVNAGHITGFLLVHIDMAPNFAGTMMGITNFAANIISIIAPLVAGVILKDEATTSQLVTILGYSRPIPPNYLKLSSITFDVMVNPIEWHTVFCITAVIYIVSNTVYILYGTSERQPWNEPITDCNILIKIAEKKALKIV